ncbi:cobyrinic acid ac-diamide synthase [Candidatus Magnetoovum chiemensis]|nr:cobyrinic acid ac-diamide synthase [Candidatus Magnetoovum chiemensis]
MAFIIAYSGKGGTGKTTLAGLTVRYLMEKTGKPILAVDADSNSCFNEALGVEIHATIGGIRESSLESVRLGNRLAGMSTEEIFDYQVQQCVIEEKGFDLIVMGRPEGPGCYCAANNIIRKYTDQLSDDYTFVVIDNEAGMEHLSRRTAHKINLMFIVSDPTIKGIKTAKRICELTKELKLEIDEKQLVINRIIDKEGDTLKEKALTEGLNPLGTIPNDNTISDIDLNGKSVFHIPTDAQSLKQFYEILDKAIKL